MRMRPFLPVLATLALLAALPAASAEPGLRNPSGPSPVTLFFHLADFQDFPINTQEPAKDFAVDSGAGVTTSSSGCLPPTPAGTGQSFHTLRGFSSPGFVEYQYIESGRPRFHPERSLSYDLELAGESVLLHWYVATQAGAPPAGSVDPDDAPLALPQVSVQATLRTGEAIEVGGGGYGDGDLVAEGRSPPATLAGPATPSISPELNWTVVDGKNVYEFRVPLTLRMPTVPKEGGFALEVATFVALPGPCSQPQDGYVMPNIVRVHSSPGFRPRLDAQVLRPLRIEYLHPQFVGDQLYLHASANSPLGNYDVDANRTGVAVTGPSPAPSVFRAAVVQRTHEHGHHAQPVDITFQWPYAADEARPGRYTVVLETRNTQGSAAAEAEATFILGDDLQVTRCGGLGEAEYAASRDGCVTEHQDGRGNPVTPSAKSPAWGLLAPLAILALGALASRRRPR